MVVRVKRTSKVQQQGLLVETEQKRVEKHEMKTVSITICDDDRTLREILRGKIERFCAEQGVPCRVSGCDSGETVLRLPPDILFLDIQMPGRNGMETAEELRRRQKDTILIFVTALSEYVYEAFDVGAFHYLVKPFSDDKLREVLERALGQYERQQETAALRQAGIAGENQCTQPAGMCGQQSRTTGDCGGAEPAVRPEDCVPDAILVKRGGISTRVLLEDIIYAEVFNRKVMLHTTGGDIEYYGKLTDLSEKAGKNFYRTHRAYLVNLKYVEKYNATTVWLEKGTVLISKKHYTGFVRQYMRYIGRKDG